VVGDSKCIEFGTSLLEESKQQGNEPKDLFEATFEFKEDVKIHDLKLTRQRNVSVSDFSVVSARLLQREQERKDALQVISRLLHFDSIQ
jgi:hypothetical protein